MPPKRRREGEGGGGGGGGGGDIVGGGSGGKSTPPQLASCPMAALTRRCRSFDLEIRGCRHLQEIANSCIEKIEAAINRIPEEVTKVLTSFFNGVPRARTERILPPTYKLSFVNSLCDKIFTKREVRAADGGLLKITITDSNQQGIISPRLLSARIKIVVLDGDFNTDSCEDRTSAEFNKHIIRPRDKVGVVLAGDLVLKLKNGETYLENATFSDNSKFTRSGKFRLGVLLMDDLGERVQEGITEPFIVKDRRGEVYKKSGIPTLDDEVWRLEKIAKNGLSRKALQQSDIITVKHFLRLYYKDGKKLRSILSNVSPAHWTKMVDHAKKCDPGSTLYSHFIKDKNIRLYFSSVGQIVGATLAGQYHAFGDLDTSSKAQVEECSKNAYECITYDHEPDYEMHNSQPRPKSTAGPKYTEFNDQIIDEAGEQDTSKGNGCFGSHSQPCTFNRLGSVRLRTLPSIEKNNETDAPFDIDVELDSGAAALSETPYTNCNAGSVTLHCPANASDEITASVALDPAALTVNQEDYEMPFANLGPSPGEWYPEQQMTSQYAFPFSASMPADHHPALTTLHSFSMDDQWLDLMANDDNQLYAPIVNELPADDRCHMARLKWKALVRASKRARLMLDLKGWKS